MTINFPGFALTSFEPISTNTDLALQPGTSVELKFSATVLNKGNNIPYPVQDGDTYRLKLYVNDEDSLDSATVSFLLTLLLESEFFKTRTHRN